MLMDVCKEKLYMQCC